MIDKDIYDYLPEMSFEDLSVEAKWATSYFDAIVMAIGKKFVAQQYSEDIPEKDNKDE